MSMSSVFDRVAKYLDSENSAAEIKKLLYCICRRKWENHADVLAQISTVDLLQELQSVVPTFRELKSVLIQIVRTLNKRKKYFIVANTILTKVAAIYPQNQAERKKIRAQLQKLKLSSKYPYDLFDLHMAVSRHSNFKRAKVVLFSALNYKFSYSPQDWTTLETTDFDRLVRCLFHACETPEDLEFRLYGTAICLADPDEHLEAARILFESMQLYYSYLQKTLEKEALEDRNQGELMTGILSGCTKPQNAQSQISAGDPCAIMSPQDGDRANILSPTETPIENIAAYSEGDRRSSPTTPDSMKQQIELEVLFREMIFQGVSEVMKSLEENILRLEERTLGELGLTDTQDIAVIKYHAIRQLLQEVQARSATYLDIIDRLEGES